VVVTTESKSVYLALSMFESSPITSLFLSKHLGVDSWVIPSDLHAIRLSKGATQSQNLVLLEVVRNLRTTFLWCSFLKYSS